MNSFSSRAKELKQRSGVTLRQIAEDCHVSESMVSRYLNNQCVPPVDVAQIIMEYLESAAADAIASDLTQDPGTHVSIRTLINLYDGRLADLQNHIDDLKHSRRVLAIALAVVVLFVFALFAIDILNPTVGWFRY